MSSPNETEHSKAAHHTVGHEIDEKAGGEYEHVDDAVDIINAESEFSQKEYSRLRWKVDFVMMPFLCMAYGLQYVDKMSLSSGVVFGLKKDTNLVGNEYANLSSFYYMAYFVAQVPMAFVLQRLPFGRTLSACVVIWGALVMCLAACNTYAQLAAVRTILGIFESPVTPSFAILTSSWYLRREQTLRQIIYCSTNYFFGVVMTLGIYFVALHSAKEGKIAGWRAINLFLGGTTVGVGLLMLVLIGNPAEVWWLSKREKRMAHARIVSNATGGSEKHPWKWEQVRECFRDPQYYHFVFFNLLGCIPNGALTTFQFLLFQSLEFDSFQSILYALPMNGITYVFIMSGGILLYYKPYFRFPIAIFFQLFVSAVWFFTGTAPDSTNKWTLWAVFIFSNSFVVMFNFCWPLLTVNVAGRTKKSFTGASQFMGYCVGNIVGSQMFIPSDAPRYRHGEIAAASVLILSGINLTLWMLHIRRENRKRDAAFQASGMTEEERTYQNKIAGELDLTDIQNQHFRYSL